MVSLKDKKKKTAQKYPNVQIVKNEVNDCQRCSMSDLLIQMENDPFGCSGMARRKQQDYTEVNYTTSWHS